MDKCWFVLRQTHYPPPTTEYLEDGREYQPGTNPLCLGDIITDLRRLDHRINQSGPEPYPLDMLVQRTTSGRLQWITRDDGTHELGGSFESPTLAALTGVTLGSDIELALKRSVSRYYDIESLETMIIQPRGTYLDRSLSHNDIRDWIKEKLLLNIGAWEAFMVSGMIVAQGKKSTQFDESAGPSMSSGMKAVVPEIIDTRLNTGYTRNQTESMSREGMSDFVWAVRLTKISKGIFDSRWSVETFSEGATFGTEQTLHSVEKLLSDEGVEVPQKISTSGGGVFILQG